MIILKTTQIFKKKYVLINLTRTKLDAKIYILEFSIKGNLSESKTSGKKSRTSFGENDIDAPKFSKYFKHYIRLSFVHLSPKF